MNREKIKIRNMTNNLINCDKISVADRCQNCGKNARLQTHHNNYNSPFDVNFLCGKCHFKKHDNKNSKLMFSF